MGSADWLGEATGVVCHYQSADSHAVGYILVLFIFGRFPRSEEKQEVVRVKLNIVFRVASQDLAPAVIDVGHVFVMAGLVGALDRDRFGASRRP